MTPVQPSIISIITKSPAPWSAKVKLQRKLAQGWELDLFSTFLSRKVEEHCLVGPFRLCRRPAWFDDRLTLRKILQGYGAGRKTIQRIEFLNKEEL